jgi:hypothetical protein
MGNTIFFDDRKGGRGSLGMVFGQRPNRHGHDPGQDKGRIHGMRPRWFDR